MQFGKPAGVADTVDTFVDDELLVGDTGVGLFECESIITGLMVILLETVVVVVLVVD